MDLLRGILRWIILAILLIVLVVLLVKLASRNSNTTKETKTKESTVNIVQKEKQEEETIEDTNMEPIQENLTVDSPDTASSGIFEVVVGSFILGVGANYIYKRRNIKENS